jgi:hypothetical protein
LGVPFRNSAARADEREAPLRAALPEAPAEDHAFRVTDRLRRWRRVRHFATFESAYTYARQHDGVVWERYAGPLGAMNWWSLTEAECEQRAHLS